MADLVLSGNTSGAITISAPSVAGTNTLTLPALTATVMTNKTAGTVLQVVNSTYSTVTSTSSSTFSDTGLSASITPSSSSNKIFVIVSINGCYKGGTDTCVKTQLVRGSTVISYIDDIAGYTGSTTTTGSTVSFNYLDSPSTTSSTTYKVQFGTDTNGRSVSINNYASGPGSVSAITLMEISA